MMESPFRMKKWINGIKKMNKIILFVGNIGCGKSTSCELFHGMHPNSVLITEYIDHKLLENYNRDPKKYGLPIQMTLFKQRKKDYEKVIDYKGKLIIMDMGLHGDIVYGMANEENMGVDGYREYRNLFYEAIMNMVSPDIIVYLKCTPITAQNRIRQRNRGNKEDTIPLAYLEKLDMLYNTTWKEIMEKHDIRVETLDWEKFKSEKEMKVIFSKLFESL